MISKQVAEPSTLREFGKLLGRERLCQRVRRGEGAGGR